MRGLKREHLGIDEATDVLSFPIDGRDELPDGSAARARRRRPLPGDRRRRVALAARARAAAPARLRPRRRDDRRAKRSSCDDDAAGADDPRLVQLRVRGDHPRPPHAAEPAHPLRDRVRGADPRADRQRDEDRADRAAHLGHVRADRRDAEHRGRGGDRHRDDVVRPDGEARQGHRGRRRADRGDQRDRRRLHRLLRARSPTARRTSSTASATSPPS